MMDLLKRLVRRDRLALSVREVQREVLPGVQIVDVRERHEYLLGSIAEAKSVPLTQIERCGPFALWEQGIALNDAPVLFICRNGFWSELVAKSLNKDLGNRTVYLNGGLLAWVGAGLPVKRQAKAMATSSAESG